MCLFWNNKQILRLIRNQNEPAKASSWTIFLIFNWVDSIRSQDHPKPWSWFTRLTFQERSMKEFLSLSIMQNDSSTKVVLEGGPLNFWNRRNFFQNFKILHFYKFKFFLSFWEMQVPRCVGAQNSIVHMICEEVCFYKGALFP